jgi:hypothetical protein
MDEAALRRGAYRVYLGKPRATIASAEQADSSLSPAFSSARDCLRQGKIISQTDVGLWRLHEVSETL